MRAFVCLAALLAAFSANAQSFDSIYNRDTGQPFKLISVKTETHVEGPVVKTRSLFTFENPYNKLTEASFNFSLADGSVLEGFAYWYKDEYVKGHLMDKQLAWYIYTAITSRNRDPGIMDQVAPESFHAQIYPLAIGYPLKIELTSIDFLVPTEDRLLIPQPLAIRQNAPREWVIYGDGREVYRWMDSGEEVAAVAAPGWSKPLDTYVLAQTFSDGRTYVAGVAKGDLGAGKPKVEGLKDVFYPETHRYSRSNSLMRTMGDMQTRSTAFVGWTTGKSITVKQGNRTVKVTLSPKKGNETAKLWAQARLSSYPRWSRQQVLDFSLKYQVPSSATALLAVPKSEMKLFEEAKKKYLSELRKQKREQERQQREWERRRNLNNSATRGGDPEIRIEIPGAIRAVAKLPDGRIINLQGTADGFWYGNFEIPLDAPEGEYKVEIIAVREDGQRETQNLTYEVDRTAPTFTYEVKTINGVRTLEVRAEKDLAEVVLVLPNGERLVLREVEPGVYRLALPLNAEGGELILVDKASNKARLAVQFS